MKDEYIRKHDAIAVAESYQVERTGFHLNDYEYGRNQVADSIASDLEDIKPADVAKIVRCENCQYRSYDEVFCCYWCEHEGMVREVKPDFYCGYGEE